MRLRRAIRRSPTLYRTAQRARLIALGTLDAAERGGDELLPPRRYRLVGGGDFVALGRRLVVNLERLADLWPDHSVLDIGCGSGRVAIPLLDYLTEGSYHGFDVVPEWVRWCSERITARNPRFRFTLADIANGKYNPDGSVSAVNYRFPAEDRSFDVVFATSVFTHLLRDDLDNYVKEAARVLVPGGRLLATFFLLNDVSLARMRQGITTLDFAPADGCFVTDPNLPEWAAAYEEDDVRDVCAKHGLEITSVHYGSWAGHETRDRQDIVVARRVPVG